MPAALIKCILLIENYAKYFAGNQCYLKLDLVNKKKRSLKTDVHAIQHELCLSFYIKNAQYGAILEAMLFTQSNHAFIYGILTKFRF